MDENGTLAAVCLDTSEALDWTLCHELQYNTTQTQFHYIISHVLCHLDHHHPVTQQASQIQAHTQKTGGFCWVNLSKKAQQKPSPNLIQFQFLMPKIIKDFIVFKVLNR